MCPLWHHCRIDWNELCVSYMGAIAEVVVLLLQSDLLLNYCKPYREILTKSEKSMIWESTYAPFFSLFWAICQEFFLVLFLWGFLGVVSSFIGVCSWSDGWYFIYFLFWALSINCTRVWSVTGSLFVWWEWAGGVERDSVLTLVLSSLLGVTACLKNSLFGSMLRLT